MPSDIIEVRYFDKVNRDNACRVLDLIAEIVKMKRDMTLVENYPEAKGVIEIWWPAD